jgi:tape measure domain-containing protein
MVAAGDLSVKLRIALADDGVAGKIARLVASVAGVRQEFDRLAASSQNVRQRLGEGVDSISRQLSRIQALALAIGGVFQGAGLAGAIARTAAEFESLQAAMRTVFGSAEAASREMQRLRAESERLGVPLQTLTRSWLGFAAAARGTAIEGEQAREVFTALTEASVVLGLSQGDLQGALLAVQQMISKGAVSSEELRQQLGERLYGAMQIAARSVGITTERFSKLLERGLIPAERFLPAFARQLRQEFGRGVEDASNTARAAFARLENSLLELKLEFARSGFMDALVDAARRLSSAFKDEAFRQSVRNFAAMIGQLTRLVVEHGDKLVVLGGVLAGARTGAAAGRLFGPKGALVGAGVGAAAGGLGAASILPDGTASGQDQKRVNDVEAAVARLKRRIEETKQAAASGLIRPEEANARIGADERRIQALLAKRAPEIAAPGSPSELGRELMRQRWDDYLKQFRSKTEELAEAMQELRTLAEEAGISETSAEFKRAAAAIRAKFADVSAAELVAAKSRAEGELAILKDGLQRQRAALDAALEDRLVSIREYYARKTDIEQREIDAEIARVRALLAEQQKIAAGARDESDRIRARGEVARLEAELIVLNNRRADVEQTNARASAKAERELADALAEAKLRLAEITGTATDADRRAAVERSFRDLRARLLAEGDVGGVSIIDRLIDVEAAQRNLQALEDAWRRAVETMRQAEQSINIQQAQGLITTSEAQRRIAAAHQEASVALEELLPKMEAAAQAIGPEAVARVQAWKNELASVKNVIDPVVATINTQVQDAFESMFTAIGTGAKSAKEAFADFGRSVLATLNRIAANKLAEQLLGMAFGAGGAGGFFKGIFGFARGGPVPGSGDRDTVPALLTPGEYVIRRDAVRRIGVAMLDAINGLRVPPAVLGGRLAFAAGGLVPAAAQAAAPTVNQAVRIVNVVDPAMAADYLTSPQGEKTVLNVLSRNAQAVRQIFATA